MGVVEEKRGRERLTRFAVVSSAREGRVELTPSYFRMEKLAGVFLLFVSAPFTGASRRRKLLSSSRPRD